MIDSISKKRPAHQRHWFHMVEPSPWPFASGWVIFGLAVSLVGYMHRYVSFMAVAGFLFLLLVVAWGWFSDVVDEADSGYHTEIVQEMLRVGFLLFIISEIMLFFSFFWALFTPPLHQVSGLDPSGLPKES
jgi:cytochrome c oxidase subunit III